MYLKKLSIKGFKNFGTPFTVCFSPGLNVLVGENGTGKSAIIDAIRLVFQEDEYGRAGITDNLFHCPFRSGAKPSDSFQIGATLTDLSRMEQTAFLPWTDGGENAHVILRVENDPKQNGRYPRDMWGGASKSAAFEPELLQTIRCVYLPPLRDAEAKLREGRGSRLARLLKVLNKEALASAKTKGDEHPLEKKVREFNQELEKSDDKSISSANDKIRQSLEQAVGRHLGQDTSIQFSQLSFTRIVENLRLLFFPRINEPHERDLFRDLDENSLGYNNLLYLATVLAELALPDDTEFLKLLLIEEPEAHLHPQLQIRLLKYLERVSSGSRIQVVVTTHSPVLASSVSVKRIIHLAEHKIDDNTIIATSISACALSEDTEQFVSRWLDATKSVLFFAKGIILVEGIEEALLLPKLAQQVLSKEQSMDGNSSGSQLPASLEDGGVSIVNMGGIYFKHFFSLFCNLIEPSETRIPVRCVGITDNDPDADALPTAKNPSLGKNPSLSLVETLSKSINCRLFKNLKTFEYDLAITGGNLKIMIPVLLSLLDTNGPIREKYKKWSNVDWNDEDEKAKACVAKDLLSKIEKGEFAQALAHKLDDQNVIFEVPEYIRKAVLWACCGKNDE